MKLIAFVSILVCAISCNLVSGARFSNSGFHQVEAPKLGRPGQTPPPAPRAIIYPPEREEMTASGFRPIYPNQKPVQRTPVASLDYGTDIITIYDLPKQSGQHLNKDTLLKTVSSSINVKPESKKRPKGRVYDDIIYDLPAGDSFKPSSSDHISTWKKITNYRPL